jgi:putative DNA primase/helicase
VLKALIGTSNYSTLSIRQIIHDKFSSADLDGKIANFSEETSPEELSDSGPFKNLTGDGEILAQKKYGDPYSFRNRAKLIMTYNEVPIFKDLSPGMMSRPIIVPFRKDLTDESAQDKNLKAKLFAELPGIFNFALEGWVRLEEQGKFSSSPLSELSKREIESASCSATRWVSEQLTFTIGETDKTYSARGLYTAYKAWHDGSGGQAMGEMKFIKRINRLPEIKKRLRHTEKGNEYFGMRIGENSHEKIEF